MGFFQNLIKDLGEAGSDASKLRSRFANISKLLSDYSFGESNYSKELTHQKIIVAYNEAVEIARKLSQKDIVRLYFTSQTVEPTIPVALKAAEYWIDFVMDQNTQFTSSLAIQLIDRAENDLKHANEKVFVNTVSSAPSTIFKVGDLLPNYMKFMKDVSSVMENCHLVMNNENCIEFKAPILTFGRIMGYNHFIVTLEPNNCFAMCLIAKGKNGLEVQSSIEWFTQDETFDEYNEHLNAISISVMQSPQYSKITLG